LLKGGKMAEKQIAVNTLGVCQGCQKLVELYYISDFDSRVDGATFGEYPDTWLYETVDHLDGQECCQGSGERPSSLKYI